MSKKKWAYRPSKWALLQAGNWLFLAFMSGRLSTSDAGGEVVWASVVGVVAMFLGLATFALEARTAFLEGRWAQRVVEQAEEEE